MGHNEWAFHDQLVAQITPLSHHYPSLLIQLIEYPQVSLKILVKLLRLVCREVIVQSEKKNYTFLLKCNS